MKKCLKCGKKIADKRKYCSTKCYGEHTRRFNPSKSELEDLYLNKKMSLEKISKHYGLKHHSLLQKRMNEYGIKMRGFYDGELKRGDRNGNWKGGVLDSGEYRVILCRNHPRSGKRKYVKEHVLIMEKHLGRFLTPEEIVHHRNGNKKDNRIENLQLCKDLSEHQKLETKLGYFAKQLLYGDLKMPYRKQLLQLFSHLKAE